MLIALIYARVALIGMMVGTKPLLTASHHSKQVH